MDIEQIRSALTSEINPTSLSELDENELASVLVIIYGKEPTILMTEKAKTLKVHAGEIAFPGGKWCAKDKDLLETAIRETKEELCLEVPKEQVVGQLDNVITLNSKYKITPFVAILENIPSLKVSSEVESILHIPLVSFLKTMAEDNLPEHRSIKEMHTFTFEKYNIWGASARMLKQINVLLSEKNLL
ncbi:CoA pyrophosphatase [Marine Group I thaumarchaeote]|jgi:8-oxo-dGTP pyrophosphatase MutT (NUDIX family)|uniref:CoA pyrophosphatase n=1 Tax=Marine Group I thaumarchaeote TaxID=2511932 RepID=A0A7K4NQ89_9ARCH|nr:CoA pyrophosphatase [Marine Group I thaumarchaeote]